MANISGVSGWITINGSHIPLLKGESKAAAYARFKDNIDNKKANAKKDSGSKGSSGSKQNYDDSKYKYLPDDDELAHDMYWDMSDECYDKLDSFERAQINKYYVKQKTSFEINEALRNGKNHTENLDEDYFESVTGALDKACTTYTAKNDMGSVRFVESNYLSNVYNLPYGTKPHEAVEKMKEFIGSEISSKGYTSVSLNKDGDYMFSSMGVRMEIFMPTGTKMYVAENLSEYEAILGRNVKLELKDVGFKDSKIKGMEKEYGQIILKYEVLK